MDARPAGSRPAGRAGTDTLRDLHACSGPDSRARQTRCSTGTIFTTNHPGDEEADMRVVLRRRAVHSLHESTTMGLAQIDHILETPRYRASIRHLEIETLAPPWQR